MSNLQKFQEQHAAGAQVVAFDYQFYYFMLLLLDLLPGQKIGFEIKDDIHIEKPDGTVILLQLKHSIVKNTSGSASNLTTLDLDLWKTLSNWLKMAVEAKKDSVDISKYQYVLATNKGEGNNKFITCLNKYKQDLDLSSFLETIKTLEDKTDNDELKSHIIAVSTANKTTLTDILSKTTINTDCDDLIFKIKQSILKTVRVQNLVDSVFESLSANLLEAKYIEIKQRKQFAITFEDFNKKYERCFLIAYKDKPLPKRNFDLNLPAKLEDQMFIKQLVDIREISLDSPKILEYTTHMLQLTNHLAFWAENDLLLPTEMTEFKKNSILIWENEFRSKYRKIAQQVNSGTSTDTLNDEIESLALDLIDFIKRENLTIAGQELGIAMSNGHFYALSNEPELGWRFDWITKYKSK